MRQRIPGAVGVILYRNRRQMLIPEIAHEYNDLVDQVEGRVHASVTVAREADAVVTFWGTPVRKTSAVWIHQCGSLAEAHAAQAAGADAVIAQGTETDGHVRGTLPGPVGIVCGTSVLV